MSWNRAPSSTRFSASRLEPELLADLDRHVADPAGMRRRVLVLRLERVRERLDGGEERPLEALERERVRERELRLRRDAGEEVELPVAQASSSSSASEREALPAVERDRGHGVRVGERRGRSLGPTQVRVFAALR